jgi:manganese/zinc/iron transport system substrate-binding protein
MRFSIIPLFGWMLMLLGCSGGKQDSDDNRLYVVATTGMLGDAVKNIVGEKAKVESLMGPGVDPHLYKAAQSDLEKLSEADIVFYNGLSLEGKMAEVLEKLGHTKKIIAVGDRLDKSRVLQTSDHSTGNLSYDPHIWFDVSLWDEAVEIIASVMIETDTANAAFYRDNFNSYSAKLNDIHKWVKDEISSVPAEQRVLITSHDAFSYFGKAYEIEVHALQGVSTASDYGLQDVTRLVNLIVDRKVKAVFIESSVASRSLKAVVEGCGNLGYEVKIGGTLFSDAMGEAGTPEGTYIGMMQANVNTIVNALR